MNPLELERLEDRFVLSSFVWSAEEVYLVELVNRARANPIAEQERYADFVASNQQLFETPVFDLTQNLPNNTSADRIRPMEPLALSATLTEAARFQNFDMEARRFFAHENPEGDDAQARADAFGYNGSAGENIAAGYTSTEIAHIAWLVSPGHRANVLSLYSFFNETFHYDEIGVAVTLPGETTTVGPDFQSYYTQVFGTQTGSQTYITGVAFNDADGDLFYTPGEGAGGIRVIVAPADQPGNIIEAVTTGEAGNYAILVPGGGAYSVTILNTATGAFLNRTVQVTEGFNLKLDIDPDDLGAYDPGNIGGIPGSDPGGGGGNDGGNTGGGGAGGGGSTGDPGGGGSGGNDPGDTGGGAPEPVDPGVRGDEFVASFRSIAPNGLADGDFVRDLLIATVPGPAYSQADWTAENYWFQDSSGDVWSLWHGGPVHLKPNGEHQWVLTNLAEAGGLSGTVQFEPGSMSGVIASWRAFSIQGVSGGQLVSLWWSPQSAENQWGNNANGWVLTPFDSTVFNDPFTGLPLSNVPQFLAFSETQSNGQTTFDPRPTRENQDGGMSVVLVATTGEVFVATFTTDYQSIPGARPDLRAKWLLEPLAQVPSIAHLGLLSEVSDFEALYQQRAGLN